MKIRTYGALTSAFLITLSTGSALADASCGCPPRVVHHAATRPAPERGRSRNADAEAYAQSFYDYHSTSTVSENIDTREESDYREDHERRRHGHWHIARNDARIRFYTYDVGIAAPYSQPQALNDNEFTGGVGYATGDSAAYGGGYGGGFVDGFGQSHFEAGQNGPTYNSYGESFQGGARGSNWHGFNTQMGPHNGY